MNEPTSHRPEAGHVPEIPDELLSVNDSVEETFRPMKSRTPPTHDGAGAGATATAPDLLLGGDPFGSEPVASYTMLERVAVGGQGEVWRARQETLRREVAVKVLRAGSADRSMEQAHAVRSQFYAEAFTAAELEHPNVVPVYDFSRHPESGEPMLAMKFVRGESWERALREDDRLDLEERLARNLPVLLAVCNAVAFAHSRGIIHRDLKPAQVILGEFGEVLLTDWGLAMRYHEDWPIDPTSPSGAMLTPIPNRSNATNPAGTPCYMAPEQVTKSTAGLGPRTDVYLLGGILYRIVTGRAPHHGDSRPEVLARARFGRVERAGAVVEGVPEELDRLMDRALDPDPQQRYATALEFRTALEEFRTGSSRRREAERLFAEARALVLESGAVREEQLIRAFKPLEETLRLWPAHPGAGELLVRVRGQVRAIRERRAFVVRWAAIGVLVLIGTMTGWYVVRLQGLRSQSEELRLKAEESRERAVQAANTMVSRLAEGLKPIAGVQTEAVRGILDDAAAIYEATMREGGESEGAVRGRAAAMAGLAESYLALGNTERALECAAETVAAYEALLGMAPGDVPAQIGLANAHLVGGVVLLNRRELGPARERLERAAEIAEGLAAKVPENEDLAYLRVGTVDRLGDVARETGDAPRAIEHYREALRLNREFAASAKRPEAWVRDRAVYEEKIGDVLLDLGQTGEALSMFRMAMATTEELLRGDPTSPQLRRDLGYSLVKLGGLAFESGDLVEAAGAYERANSIREELARLDPSNRQLQRELHLSRQRLGDLAEARGELAVAAQWYQSSLAVIEALVAQDPANRNWRRDLSTALNKKADVASQLGDAATALEHYTRALAEREELLRRDPTNPVWQRSLAISLSRTAGALADAQRTTDALVMASRATTLLAEVSAADAKNVAFQKDLAVMLGSRARIERRAGLMAESQATAQRGIELARELVAGDPDDVGFATSAGMLRFDLGAALLGQDRFAEARAELEQAVESARKRVAGDPLSPGVRDDLAAVLEALSLAAGNLGDAAAAAGAREEALAIRRDLEKKYPGNVRYARERQRLEGAGS